MEHSGTTNAYAARVPLDFAHLCANLPGICLRDLLCTTLEPQELLLAEANGELVEKEELD